MIRGFSFFMSMLFDFLQMGVMRRDPVRTQMVNEILENVHHIWRDIMKGNGVIAATVWTRLGRVENVAPIPHIFGNVSGYEMMLRAVKLLTGKSLLFEEIKN